MPDETMDGMRQMRSTPARLKLQIAKIRSANPNRVVFLFEGKEDKLAYRSWIQRCDDDIDYEPLVANGKDAVLDVRAMVLRDRTGAFDRIYFFVDRDFDGLKGHAANANTFCTSRYSIENYLVEERVIDRLLCDYFHCHGDESLRHGVIKAYRSAITQLCEALYDLNQRIYFARTLGIAIEGGIPELGGMLEVGLTECKLATDRPSEVLLRLRREPTAEEVAELGDEFAKLAPVYSHRGKFFMEFFKKWIRRLADDSASDQTKLFKAPLRPVVDANVLGIGTLALHSSLPEELSEFVESMAA